jgi:hypothetical protein
LLESLTQRRTSALNKDVLEEIQDLERTKLGLMVRPHLELNGVRQLETTMISTMSVCVISHRRTHTSPTTRYQSLTEQVGRLELVRDLQL